MDLCLCSRQTRWKSLRQSNFIGLLLSCIRATLSSRQFKKEGDQEFPTSADNGLIDSVVNRFPRIVWPRAQIAFLVLAMIYLLLTIVGSALFLTKAKNARMTTEALPSTTLKVSPPR